MRDSYGLDKPKISNGRYLMIKHDSYNPKELVDLLGRAQLDLITGKSIQSNTINRLIYQVEQYVTHGRPVILSESTSAEGISGAS